MSNVPVQQAHEDGTSSGMIRSRREVIIGAIIRYTVIALALAFALFPVIFVLASSFNPTGNLSTRTLIPQGIEQPSDLIPELSCFTDR